MANIYKQDVNNNETILITYNNGLDSITKQDIINALENSAINNGYEQLNDISDTSKCSSSKFNVMLKDIGNIFKSTKALYINKTDLNYNSGACAWEYDKKKLLYLINIYTDICFKYNKRCCISGFLNFCGITDNFIRYNEKEPLLSDNLRDKIVKRLAENDDEQQKNNARDSKQPILNLAYNNYVHGWNGEIKRNEINGALKSLDDIKRERLEMSADNIQG